MACGFAAAVFRVKPFRSNLSIRSRSCREIAIRTLMTVFDHSLSGSRETWYFLLFGVVSCSSGILPSTLRCVFDGCRSGDEVLVLGRSCWG